MHVCERTICPLKVSPLNQEVLLQGCLLKGVMPLIGNQNNISIITALPFAFLGKRLALLHNKFVTINHISVI